MIIMREQLNVNQRQAISETPAKGGGGGLVETCFSSLGRMVTFPGKRPWLSGRESSKAVAWPPLCVESEVKTRVETSLFTINSRQGRFTKAVCTPPEAQSQVQTIEELSPVRLLDFDPVILAKPSNSHSFLDRC